MKILYLVMPTLFALTCDPMDIQNIKGRKNGQAIHGNGRHWICSVWSSTTCTHTELEKAGQRFTHRIFQTKFQKTRRF